MSASTSASRNRRVSLLASGSTVTAMLIGAAGALMLAPAPALAADECGPSSGVQTCSGTFPSISYPITTGNLTLNLANDLTVTTGGLSANGTLGNSVTLGRSNTGGADDPSITNTGGAGISVINATGAITANLTDPGFDAGPGLAVTGTTFGVDLRTGATTGSALTLTTTNGSITATSPGGVGVRTATTSVGGGNTTLNIGGLVSGATGIQASSSGTGSITVNVTASGDTVEGGEVVGGAGPAILLSPNAAATITIGDGGLVRSNGGANAVVEVTNLNGALTFNNLGELRSNEVSEAGHDDLAFRVGGGAGAITMRHGQLENPGTCFGTFCFGQLPAISAHLQGRLELANTGATTLTLLEASEWRTAGMSVLGEGATTVNHGPSALIAAGGGGVETQLDFGAGNDTYNQEGTLAFGGAGTAATLILSDLETWNSSGRVLFGANADYTATDGAADDRLVATGGATPIAFTGNAATLVLDVNLGAGTQSSCAEAVVADCLDLTGGSTGGSTAIVLNNISTGIGALNDGIVVVDVSGGTSAADHFVLSEATEGWRAPSGGGSGIVDAGLFVYGLAYDADTQQHMLVSAPDGEALEFALFGTSAHSVWETTTGSWFDRQVDLRETLGAGDAPSGPGAWVRMTGNYVNRSLYQSFEFNGGAFELDHSYEQETRAVVGGVDFVGGSADGRAWAAGLTVGTVRSGLGITASRTELELDGYSVGAYATYTAGPFFVDAIVNRNALDAEYSSPSLDVSEVAGQVNSLGYQAEAGYRISISEGYAFIEPLLALAQVTTTFDDLSLPGATVAFPDIKSFKGAVGVRLAGTLPMETMTSSFGLTGRIWQEFEGENEAILLSGDSSFSHIDDTSGTLADVGVTASLSTNNGRLSLLFDTGVKFKEDYQSADVSIGLRFGW